MPQIIGALILVGFGVAAIGIFLVLIFTIIILLVMPAALALIAYLITLNFWIAHLRKERKRSDAWPYTPLFCSVAAGTCGVLLEIPFIRSSVSAPDRGLWYIAVAFAIIASLIGPFVVAASCRNLVYKKIRREEIRGEPFETSNPRGSANARPAGRGIDLKGPDLPWKLQRWTPKLIKKGTGSENRTRR
jgi:hypothetical protein